MSPHPQPSPCSQMSAALEWRSENDRTSETQPGARGRRAGDGRGVTGPDRPGLVTGGEPGHRLCRLPVQPLPARRQEPRHGRGLRSPCRRCHGRVLESGRPDPSALLRGLDGVSPLATSDLLPCAGESVRGGEQHRHRQPGRTRVHDERVEHRGSVVRLGGVPAQVAAGVELHRVSPRSGRLRSRPSVARCVHRLPAAEVRTLRCQHGVRRNGGRPGLLLRLRRLCATGVCGWAPPLRVST